MKNRIGLLACSVVLLAACTSAPYSPTVDAEITDYRLFLNDVATQLHEANVNAVGFNDADVSDLLLLVDDIERVMGSHRSFDDMESQQYARFLGLTQKLYQGMCSNSGLVENRTRLYEMLMTPRTGAGVASL